MAFQEESEGGFPRELLMRRRESLSLLSQRPEAGEGEEMRKMKVVIDSRIGKGEAMAGSVVLCVSELVDEFSYIFNTASAHRYKRQENFLGNRPCISLLETLH